MGIYCYGVQFLAGKKNLGAKQKEKEKNYSTGASQKSVFPATDKFVFFSVGFKCTTEAEKNPQLEAVTFVRASTVHFHHDKKMAKNLIFPRR